MRISILGEPYQDGVYPENRMLCVPYFMRRHPDVSAECFYFSAKESEGAEGNDWVEHTCLMVRPKTFPIAAKPV